MPAIVTPDVRRRSGGFGCAAAGLERSRSLQRISGTQRASVYRYCAAQVSHLRALDAAGIIQWSSVLAKYLVNSFLQCLGFLLSAPSTPTKACLSGRACRCRCNANWGISSSYRGSWAISLQPQHWARDTGFSREGSVALCAGMAGRGHILHVVVGMVAAGCRARECKITADETGG